MAIKLLVYLLFSGIFFLDFLYFKYGIGIRPMVWIPEMVTLVIALVIPFRTSFSKTTIMPVRYYLLLLIYLAHLGIGFLINDITGWTILAGLRVYTKFIPIMMIPLLFPFSEKEFKRFVYFIFFLSMLQFPVVLLQRFVLYAGHISGDPMGGTLGHHSSGILTVHLMIVISFIVAFYYQGKMPIYVFIPALIAAFVPVTLNETKVSFVLLPLAFLFPAVFVRAKIENMIRILMVMLILGGAVIALFNIYNYFIVQRWGYGIDTWVSLPNRMEKYSLRRVYPFQETYKKLSQDIRYLTFGFGAGNCSTGFTPRLSGKYADLGAYYGLKLSSINLMVWEIGAVGLFIYFSFHLFVFLDAIRLSRDKGFVGAFALGMVSFSAFFVISSVYFTNIKQNIFVYLFFFCAGYIIRQTMEAEGEADGEAEGEAQAPEFEGDVRLGALS